MIEPFLETTIRRRPWMWMAVGALALGVLSAGADEGQGTAAPDTTVDGLNLGTYWFGAEIDKRDLTGKVVLVELWGS